MSSSAKGSLNIDINLFQHQYRLIQLIIAGWQEICAFAPHGSGRYRSGTDFGATRVEICVDFFQKLRTRV